MMCVAIAIDVVVDVVVVASLATQSVVTPAATLVLLPHWQPKCGVVAPAATLLLLPHRQHKAMVHT